MELPKPPAWYWLTTEGTPPPSVPANGNLRSFGSADFDEGFWEEDDDELMATKVENLKRRSREIVMAFAEAVKEEDVDLEAIDAKFAELHQNVGKLRIHEARASLIATLEHEIRERTEAVRRYRARMASAFARVDEILGDDDYVEHEKLDLARHYEEVTLAEALRDPTKLLQKPRPSEEEEDGRVTLH
mmetsp:Transcript_37903/g.121608  ORF Transcript_37903/g.121608 Transcript_37903/m.121608 type:complete len:188 (-) Transcript_37903:1027-1590(-)